MQQLTCFRSRPPAGFDLLLRRLGRVPELQRLPGVPGHRRRLQRQRQPLHGCSGGPALPKSKEPGNGKFVGFSCERKRIAPYVLNGKRQGVL